jgi:hypothetical protein
LPLSAQRSALGIRSRPSTASRDRDPPAADASQIFGCDFSGTALTKAIVCPSGDQRGELSPSSWSEIFVSGPPFASITQTSVLCPSSNALPVRSDTNAIRRPSGDH